MIAGYALVGAVGIFILVAKGAQLAHVCHVSGNRLFHWRVGPLWVGLVYRGALDRRLALIVCHGL